MALPRPVHRLVADLPHHRRASAARGPEGVPAQPGPWRSVSEGRSGSVGRDVPDRSGPGRTGIARISGLLPQGGVPFRRRHPDLHRDHPSGTAGRLRRADRAPGRRALQAVFRPVRLLPAVPRESADSGAQGGGNGQGRRHRHVLYVRRRHRRRMVARPEPAAAFHHPAQRPHRHGHPGLDRIRGRQAHLPGNRRQDHVLRT